MNALHKFVTACLLKWQCFVLGASIRSWTRNLWIYLSIYLLAREILDIAFEILTSIVEQLFNELCSTRQNPIITSIFGW